ncbi:hypothetical protein IWX90DRAFT_415550 [Phyllosticta citrichinensis]|uniref:Doubled CXXCH motif domain-containing protein n=1 Tax=Phyllosticta citrichinensis TaxID=1130410 RepID=A0ABR1XPX9_9PEZI
MNSTRAEAQPCLPLRAPLGYGPTRSRLRWGGVAVGRVGCAYAPAERQQTLQPLSTPANHVRYEPPKRLTFYSTVNDVYSACFSCHDAGSDAESFQRPESLQGAQIYIPFRALWPNRRRVQSHDRPSEFVGEWRTPRPCHSTAICRSSLSWRRRGPGRADAERTLCVWPKAYTGAKPASRACSAHCARLRKRPVGLLARRAICGLPSGGST